MTWPQDRTRVETLDHLIELSYIRNVDLQHVNLAHLRHLEEEYKQYRSIRPENREKNLIVYNSLTTEDERNIFKLIHSNLSQHTGDDVTAILIDSIPCDKRSFFLLCVSITLDTEIAYIVFRRVLKGTHKRANKMSTYTAHQFLKNNFELVFEKVDDFFMDFSVSCSEMLQKIIRRPLKRIFNLLILDEYTVLSPWYVLWIYWIAKYHRIPIIFFGDKSMLGSMSPSRFHTKNNYAIAKILARPICYSLKILDTEYRQKVDAFKKILDRTNEIVSLSEDHMSMLQQYFEQKFEMEENFKAIFLSQFHVNLYRRAYRILDHVIINGIEHYCIPYRIEGTEKEVPIDRMRKEGGKKFLEFLLLIKDFIYTYAPSRYNEKFVRFENINEETGIVTVTDIKDGREYQLSRVRLEDSVYVRTELDWLSTFGGGRSLCQYPLRLLCKTYHSVQGLTMPTDCKVELDLSGYKERRTNVYANAVYVGLLSVTSEEQLGKFHITYFGGQLFPRSSNTNLMQIAKYLRYVPRDDVYAKSSTLKDLVRHFHKFLNDKK